MPDSIDDLLAQIKAANSRAASHSPMPTPPDPPENSLDALLAELNGDTVAKANAKPASAQPSSSNNPTSANRANPLNSCKPVSQAASANAETENLLADLKAIYAEQDRAEQQRRATFKRQKQAANIRQAEAWLKTLDTQSTEAAWFEEFAAKYTSKVEAAMDYLGLTAE
jgi:hypothetical protein